MSDTITLVDGSSFSVNIEMDLHTFFYECGTEMRGVTEQLRAQELGLA